MKRESQYIDCREFPADEPGRLVPFRLLLLPLLRNRGCAHNHRRLYSLGLEAASAVRTTMDNRIENQDAVK